MKKRRIIRRRTRTNLGAASSSDYVAIAKILCSENASPRMKQRFADYFGGTNARFREAQFLAATNACKR
jgi:hypothetical protein